MVNPTSNNHGFSSVSEGQRDQLLLAYPLIELVLLLFYFAIVELVLDLAIDRISIICRPEAT
jgi:hypothetical protein